MYNSAEVPPERKAARLAVAELRTLLLNAPELFVAEVERLISEATDEPTRRFWAEMRNEARRERLTRRRGQ